MDLFEEIVLFYLNKTKNLPTYYQFSILDYDKSEWSCPDFIAFNNPEKIVYVIEVSVAYNIDSLIDRINDRQNQWFIKLRNQLLENETIDVNWVFHVLVFLRDDRLQYFNQKLIEKKYVEAISIEKAMKEILPWWK